MLVSSLEKVLVALLLGVALSVPFTAAQEDPVLRGGASAFDFASDYGVAANEGADVGDQHSRALWGGSYHHYSGACRYNGKDKYYKRFKGSLYDYHWCEKKCSQDHQCYAFEHYYKPGGKKKKKKSGYDQHCEIWRIKPNGYKHNEYFKCKVKKSAPSGGEDCHYKMKPGACRLSTHEDGYKNKHYKRYKWDYHKCADYCCKHDKCEAFEHDKKKHCEIWYYKPYHWTKVGNLKCYHK
uniref:Apple domain-containing protein n=1 Tax=Pseudictyota dubia TaxID=2749911 RepID=A0A7R9W0E7_9STRA|mmetsp:Transcript_2707/g.4869  ORF Transcript_2707/g.4869 Transcript_2707/m.4869 type:complete len:238 (+) Transcript_2707:63-776(+)